MTPKTAQAISDMMNSPALSATIGLAMVALGAAALVIIKKGQKTEADVTAARKDLKVALLLSDQKIADLREKVRCLGVEKFILSINKKPPFDADAAEEYITGLCIQAKNERNRVFANDNAGRGTFNQIYSDLYMRLTGEEIAYRKVLEYFAQFEL